MIKRNLKEKFEREDAINELGLEGYMKRNNNSLINSGR